MEHTEDALLYGSRCKLANTRRPGQGSTAVMTGGGPGNEGKWTDRGCGLDVEPGEPPEGVDVEGEEKREIKIKAQCKSTMLR